ncbi:signal peptidase I [Pseudokineococcus sp. 5B2Z-1]|uniref:signal peptidase I n=1 Tax=Pseudokineococcus sp. 5B2Z-1 TaxID=3132744 RepID=UPI0030AE8097
MSRTARAGRALVAVLLVAAAVLALRAFVVEVRHVEGASMAPSLRGGGLVLLDKLAPRLAGVDPGDVVVLRAPGGEDVVKRVVAVGGQEVSISEAVLHVDGRAVDEPQVDHEAMDGVLLGPLLVPEGSVYVLGDERGASVDSRDFGPVDAGAVVGRVVWPRTGAWSVGADAAAERVDPA